MRVIKHIVIHCTATPQTATVESIQKFWRDNMGWKSPGYHYLIEPNGEVNHLQDEAKVSNGVAGHNKHAINISYIGGVDKDGKTPKDNRTDAQTYAMTVLLRTLVERYPDAEILGHRDFSKDANGNGIIEEWEYIKHCPSFDVKEWLKSINF